MSDDTQSIREEFNQGRSQAVGMTSVVYIGAVLAATVIFLSFILTAFPETAFLVRALMVLSGLLVGAAGLAYPVILHQWAVSGKHRIIATVFYYGEIAILILNTIVSFSALLYTFAGAKLPDWVAWYEPFTIVSLGYVILALGTIYITDPRSKARAKQIEVLEKFDHKVAEGMEAYLRSNDGLEAIQANANERIARNFSVRNNTPQPWIKNNSSVAPWSCSFCESGNVGSAMFCSQCGAPKGAASQTTQAPAGARPALPPPPSRTPAFRIYTLDELLAAMGLNRDSARSLVRQYGLYDANSAYNAFNDSGYIPQDFGSDPGAGERFLVLYCELAGVAPTWALLPAAAFNPSIMPPPQAQPIPSNGASHKSF